MRFMLMQKHYVDDRLLEANAIVGDPAEGQPPTVHPWRYARENKRIGVTAGQAMKPTRAMSPVDDEGRKLFRDTFGEEPPEMDPTMAIPIQGSVSQSPPPPPPFPTPGGGPDEGKGGRGAALPRAK